jgi:glycosyltransferase involved in cell wall biosynthesis
MSDLDPFDVSVVVPAYNGEAYIAETLSSILAQTVPAREVIVINDGSTDRIEEIVRGFGSAVTLISTPNNGVQAARDLGSETAKGTWIALCDQDDLWEPAYLEAQARLIKHEPELEFLFSNFHYLHDGVLSSLSKFDQAPVGYWDELNPRKSPQGWVVPSSIAGASFVFHPLFPSALIVRKALIMAVGGFDPRLRGLRNEDAAFVMKCLLRARIGAQPRSLVRIRRHATNYSRHLLPRLLDEIGGLRKAFADPGELYPYRAIIGQEVTKRTAAALNAAFSLQDHALVRELFDALPPAARTRKILLKRWVASVPEPFGTGINRLLQRAAGGKVATPDDFIR